jgi:acyl-CoA thioesterase I
MRAVSGKHTRIQVAVAYMMGDGSQGMGQQSTSSARFVGRLREGMPQHVVTYGCSLTAGGAWVAQLGEALGHAFPGLARVTNSGMGAMWSGWGVENLDERVIALQPDAVLIEFSMNDAYLPYETSTEGARQNLESMIDRIIATRPSCEIILMVMNPPTGDHLVIRPHIECYNQVYRDVARQRSLLLVDHYPRWQRLLDVDRPRFFEHVPDGLHPGEAGCQVMITPHLLASLGVAATAGPE